MGKRGPKPQSQNVLKLRGQFRKDRHGDVTDFAGNGKLTPPAWLHERALPNFWRAAEGLLKIPGLADDIDSECVASYALAVLQFADASKAIEEQGLTLGFVDRYGNATVKLNPAVQARDKAHAIMAHWTARFGFSPGDRANMKLGKCGNKESPFSEFAAAKA